MPSSRVIGSLRGLVASVVTAAFIAMVVASAAHVPSHGSSSHDRETERIQPAGAHAWHSMVDTPSSEGQLAIHCALCAIGVVHLNSASMPPLGIVALPTLPQSPSVVSACLGRDLALPPLRAPPHSS